MLTFILLVGAIAVFATYFFAQAYKNARLYASGGLLGLAVVSSAFSSVPSATAGIVTSFGAISDRVLTSGLHVILPWQSVNDVFLGQQTSTVEKSQASSHDLQSVHSDLAVNFTVKDPLRLYSKNPDLTYETLIIEPAIQEIFKAIVARYTAEELITRRSEVSDAITSALAARLSPYFISVQQVNLTNFGFSRSFDQAIEEKVTATQKSETARRNLERVKYEAQARIEQAEGEAKAISIQSAAITASGGKGYVQLQAIQKWDGKLPTYMGGNAPVPFINAEDK